MQRGHGWVYSKVTALKQSIGGNLKAASSGIHDVVCTLFHCSARSGASRSESCCVEAVPFGCA